MLKEFKEFAARGNVIDLAVGVIIGAAFGKIVTSLVNDIVMPPIGMLLGQVDFKNFFVALNRQSYASLAEAQKAGAPDAQLRPVPQHGVRVPDRGLRCLPAGPSDQSAQETGVGGLHDQGVPALPVENSGRGVAMRALHVGSRAGPGLIPSRSIASGPQVRSGRSNRSGPGPPGRPGDPCSVCGPRAAPRSNRPAAPATTRC